jgi:hypothetical protein
VRALIGFDSGDDAQRVVDRPLVPSRVLLGLVVWQGLEQAERVVLLRIEYDAVPELVDPDGFDPAVFAVPDLLQVNPRVGMLTELPDGSLDKPCTGFSSLAKSPSSLHHARTVPRNPSNKHPKPRDDPC